MSEELSKIVAGDLRDSVPPRFAGIVTDLHGRAGVDWLKRLPALLAECAARWSLTLGRPFAPLTYNYVVRAARADGTPAALKVGVPARELLTEMAALRHTDGRGAVRLLDADEERGALLLERLTPGTSLVAVSESDDGRATSVAAGVMRKLWRPAPPEHKFPSVDDWAEAFGRLRARFDGATGPLPTALVDEAERLCAELSASATDSATEPVLLHGDLHHDNILSAGREPWLAIDPKGVVGDPAFEVGALLRNPMQQLLRMSEPRRVTARRIDQLAEELSFDRARLRGWGLVGALLSACWTVEDGGRVSESEIAVAELIRDA